MGIAFFLGVFWIIYVIIFISIIYISKLIYRSTKNKYLVISFCVAMFLISVSDILYGNYAYMKNENSWPDYTVNRSIDTVFKYNDLSFFRPVDDNFNIKLFLSSLSLIYNSKDKTVSTETRRMLKVDLDRPKELERYVVLEHKDLEYGTCSMKSEEIYDISTGEMLGRSREIYLLNVSYLPFFRSFLGMSHSNWGYSKYSFKANNRSLRNEVFPNYKF